ncbi:MAG: ABC transporter ATP-binding protein [Candidatus Aenigmarchaeota archaeon]|nr:ABC transporter ATP-binding protein [Candidatus Aenigmarchaeota archaeon]
MVNKKIVVLEDVTVKYGDAIVLKDANLSVYEHDFLGIIGPNGGGKTTILKLMLGLIKPTKGSALLYGETPEKNRSLIGYVPQYSHFDRDFPASVWDTVMMGRLAPKKCFKKFDENDKKIVCDALKTVDIFNLRDRQISCLSGGQLQRVLVARALASEPKILLLDEPTASIDGRVESSFYELLAKLKKNMAIILVSHNVGAISIYVDKIACVNQTIYYHDDKEIRSEDIAKIYKCPVELIAHGVAHRVLEAHEPKGKKRNNI